jgi:RND family efflux transporter MFP subunit
MKHVSWITWPALALLTIFTACQKSGVATAPPSPPEVLVTDVVVGDVPIIRSWVGTLDGSENAQIKARVTGYLQTRNYNEGAAVKKGDALFEIDPRPYVAALAQAKAQLEQTKATALAAKLDADRSAELFQRKVISEQDYTNKKQDAEAKAATQLAAEAAADDAQLNLNYTKIISPVDGIAGQALAQIGDLVGTGGTGNLTTVSTVDPIRLYFPISEQDFTGAAERFRVAMQVPEAEREAIVELILPDDKVYPRKGKFAFVDRNIDPKTGTIQIAISFPNPDFSLRPGQFARARVEIQTIPKALLVPRRAVSQMQGDNQVVVVNADGKAEIRSVKLGPVYNQFVTVTEGVKSGEKVVAEGFQRVRQGMTVSAKPYLDPLHAEGAAKTSDQDPVPPAK